MQRCVKRVDLTFFHKRFNVHINGSVCTKLTEDHTRMTQNLGGDRRLISENCFEWQVGSEEHEPRAVLFPVPFLSRGLLSSVGCSRGAISLWKRTLGPGARAIRSNRAPGRRGKLVSSFFLFLVGASLFFLYFSLFREDTNNPGEQGATYSRTFICSEDSSSSDVPWLVTERCSVSALAFLQITVRFVSSRIFRHLTF